MSEPAPGRPHAGRDRGGLVDLQEAARRLDVHYMTAYRYVRTGRLPATQSAGRWWVRTADLLRFGAKAPAGQDRQAARRVRVTELRKRLVDGDEQGSWQILQLALTSGYSPTQVVVELLAGAMRQVGNRWQSGSLAVGDEHRATAVATRLTGRLGPLLSRPGRRRGDLVLACVPNERHALPLELLAVVLRGEGYRVVDLGADTPAQEIGAAAAASGTGLLAVCLSVSTDGRGDDVAAALSAVRSAAPTVPVLVGGPAVGSRRAARTMGADAWAADAARTVDVLQRLERTASQ